MRLSLKTIKNLPGTIRKPAYDNKQSNIGIVHLGIGAFHRCHMAVYTEDVLEKFGGDWKILGVSLRSKKISSQLNPQDGLYTIIVKDDEASQTRVISSVDKVLFAPESTQEVINSIANKSTKIISLTVTEKGYCHDPATGELNEEHSDISHDLLNPERPISAIGYIVSGLNKRQEKNAGPITIMSCDNLPANGRVLEKIVLSYANLTYPGLDKWILKNVTFPCTMVDRIVPAMEAGDVSAFTKSTGIIDQAVLQTEPFTQWVIEDKFLAGRPQWEQVGASLVDDVDAYEDTKLRMLNGSHSALAYLGFLAGYAYIDEAMADSGLRQFADIFMRKEAATSLTLPDELDINAYREDLKKRYDNSALKHRTYQIAMDGSQKVPQRFLQTLRYHLKKNGPIGACCLALAAWIRYTKAEDESGQNYIVQDPMASKFKSIFDKNKNDTYSIVKDFLNIQEVFGTDLSDNEVFTNELSYFLENILTHGTKNTVNDFVKAQQ